MMRESVIEFQHGEDHLFGVMHSPPADVATKEVMVVFLHGWAGYRIGPHQMFVKFARGLSNQGYHCLRFDFRGRGFSSGHRDDTTPQTMMADLQLVLSTLVRQYPRHRIVLLGICSGAKLCLRYARNGPLPIDHLIALSTPQPGGNRKVTKEVRQTAGLLGEYWQKLFRYETWEKVRTRSINAKRVIGIVGSAIRGLGAALCYAVKVRSRGRTVGEKGAVPADAARPFALFGGHVLLIHGERDPETETALAQLTELLQRYRVAHQCAVIRGANHSFYAQAWENEIYYLIGAWLTKRYPAAEPRPAVPVLFGGRFPEQLETQGAAG